MFTKLKPEPTSNDRVVVIDQNGTADIATVYDQDDQKIYAESTSNDYAIPMADTRVLVGSVGRIYVLQADSEYVSDTKRLAALEKSIVLRQVTQFEREREADKKGLDIKQILLYAMIAVLIIGVIVK